MKATDQCRNCGDEFANHTYVKDSITKYRCPRPHQEVGYGLFPGGDPNKFFPDPECCTKKEMINWKAACEGREFTGGFGIGGYVTESVQFFSPREHNYERSE